MKLVDARIEDSFHIEDSNRVKDEVEGMRRIIDTKYEKADIPQIMAGCDHLTEEEKQKLQSLLTKYELLFYRTLGKWHNEVYMIELKPGAEPYHARAYPVPKAYESTLRMKVDQLVQAGVLKKVNRSEWAAPSFIIPKKIGVLLLQFLEAADHIGNPHRSHIISLENGRVKAEYAYDMGRSPAGFGQTYVVRNAQITAMPKQNQIRHTAGSANDRLKIALAYCNKSWRMTQSC